MIGVRAWTLAIVLAVTHAPALAAAGDAAGSTPAGPAEPGPTTGAAATGEPAPMTAEARALYEEGLGLYAAHDFAAAIRRFEDGYALEARREFLFAEAQAFRLAGDCAHAVPLYQRFLQTAPSSLQIDATRMGLDRCEKQETAARAAAALARTRPAPPLLVTPPAPPRPAPDRPRWWLDPVGLAATAAGVVALGAGAGFIIASNDALDHANSPSTPTHAEYVRLYDLAEQRRTVGLVATVGGAVALAGGLARLAFVRHRTRAAERGAPTLLTCAPSSTGATLLWQGSY
jgi:tetratricopeptide (TPR) repeat protein